MLNYWVRYNEQFIRYFRDYLKTKNFSDRLIHKYISNVSFFGNYYLLTYISDIKRDPQNAFGRVITLPKTRGIDIRNFLGDFLICNTPWQNIYFFKNYISVLRRFFFWLSREKLYLQSEKELEKIEYYLKHPQIFYNQLKRYKKIMKIENENYKLELLDGWKTNLFKY